MAFKILVADDEIKANKVAQKNYKKEINNISSFAGDGEEALKIIESKRSSIDLVLVDIKMMPVGGLEFIQLLKEKNLQIKFIAISAYVSTDEVKQYFENNDNFLGFLEKPFDPNELNGIIQRNFPQVLVSKTFDYANLDSETSLFVKQQTGEIKALMKRTAQGILEIGQKLLEIKQKLGHGNFLDWLKVEFNWSEPTAQRFMQVARQFESINLMDLEIAPSALYVLSAPSTLELVRQEAIARAQAGENITYTTAQEIKQKYQPTSSSKVKKDKKLVFDVESSVSDRPRTRAVEALNKPEILAVIPKQITENGETIVRAGSWYQLREEHLLYCGEPNSPQFKQRLPKEIALSIAFPPTPEWQLANPIKANSEVAFFSQYQDADFMILREMVQRALELYTEDNESVVFSFLPDPELITLAHQLSCRCFVAEPDIGRCELAVKKWNER